MNTINFFLTGVGGQGTLLASNVLAQVGVQAGFDVKKAEGHGMAAYDRCRRSYTPSTASTGAQFGGREEVGW